jgi:hypothetical protein
LFHERKAVIPCSDHPAGVLQTGWFFDVCGHNLRQA